MVDIQQYRADVLWNKFQPFVFHAKYSGVNHGTSVISIFLIAIISIALSFILLLIARLIYNLVKSLKEPSALLQIIPPSLTEKTGYTTAQLFSVIHRLGKDTNLFEKLVGRKTRFSFEIVSSKTEGIRYVIRTTEKEVKNLKRNLLSYLPGVQVRTISEYLPGDIKLNPNKAKIVEFTLDKPYPYPLQKQNMLEEHDPVAYITGQMTKLENDELLSFQIVLSPVQTAEARIIKQKVFRGEDVLAYIDSLNKSISLNFLTIPFRIIKNAFGLLGWAARTVIDDAIDPRMAPREAQSRYLAQFMAGNNLRPARMITPFEQKQVESIEQKIDQPLFETRIRLLLVLSDKNDLKERIKGFSSSLSVFSDNEYQSLRRKRNLFVNMMGNYLYLNFRKRLLSFVFNNSHDLLSASEISDIYHFPYSRVTQTENIVKVYSKELPPPISLKQNQDFDVVFAENTYGGTTTPIGLTKEERKTHMYIIGRTGSGKTTLMFSMAKHDIEHNEGLAFIDPHGDVSEDLLACIPEDRINDLIYLNPFDLKYPIGINLLELTPGLDEDEAELEKEVVAEGVVSLFRKVFSKEENANAHRIEYILRNTIHTAFTVKDPTIFTLYDLLNNPPFQKSVVAKLKDENLKNFWKFEFGWAGDFQVVKMVGGVTAKIGRFLFSPTAKRILEQKRSTIDFGEILNGKILICNLSQGKLGEDTARLLGTTILTKLQQAALKRADVPQSERRQFHLYVDEFQNFATLSFAKMLSEGRKYGLEVYIAEQSTSQQQDKSIVNIILGNVTTVVCFRSGNPLDEDLLLDQFFPYVVKGEIYNLPRYQFYIKISAIESEEPFSGRTIFVPVKKNPEKRKKLVETSRKNWAITYQKPKTETKEDVNIAEEDQTKSEEKVVIGSNGLPKINGKK